MTSFSPTSVDGKKNLASNSGCAQCGDSSKNDLHAIRDFHASKEIWMNLVVVDDCSKISL